MITTLAFDNNTPTPKKLVEIPAGRVARVKIQVLDASTVFLGNSRDVMAQKIGTNSLQQGLQVTQNSGIYSDWWAGGDERVGEIWAVGSINGATVDVEIDVLPAALFGGRGAIREVTQCAQCGSQS